jgi:uncharacterized membrane protein YdjX (TVP38/TMEM64 family)
VPQRKIVLHIGALAGLAALFVAVSYSAHVNEPLLTALVRGGGGIGEASFIALTALFVIFVIPLDIVLLIPIGAVVWGPVPTALMSIAGWTIGSAVAFGIARQFGAGPVGTIIGLERVRTVEKRIPKKNLFGGIILLRMLVSVDILSYALGLFSRIPWSQYILATLIGVTPFGFYFAYAGALPLWYQIGAVGFAFALAGFVIARYGISREP